MERTILIIDDDVNIRKMLSILIKKNNLGKVVEELKSGDSAVEEILFYNPDIVLIDLLLPVIDGLEIIKLAKGRGYTGKFIMISQVEDKDMISKAYEAGILFFINKPINDIEVINVIKGVCYNIELENSISIVKNAVFNMRANKEEVHSDNIDNLISKIFIDLGIAGDMGSNDLKKVIKNVINIKKTKNDQSYYLQDIYEKIVEEESGKENLSSNKKAFEQRIRRIIQKAFQTITELGVNDYSNIIFLEYSTILFDFSQIRQQMRHIENHNEKSGKINIKKFIEGIIAKINLL
ncbi:response regulator [Tissierella sp. MSJ-40]|uniref:Response regulator n=1 Tax=Tissierella simiarum TaxID=2841534 RepID=A0ABS6E1C8_9FIRM|nr:response regulator [Tissierella simiarum]MBU5436709.1 response regulator [Tissierella simiarum]